MKKCEDKKWAKRWKSAKKCWIFEKNSVKVYRNAKNHEHLPESLKTCEECEEVWSLWMGEKCKKHDECVWSLKYQEVTRMNRSVMTFEECEEFELV